jgi:hypothetical protein
MPPKMNMAKPKSPPRQPSPVQAGPKKVGRPRKADDEGTPKQRKQREYMRTYIASINQGIENLAKDERDCMKELDRITQEKKRLFDELDKANGQMLGILNERLGR